MSENKKSSGESFAGNVMKYSVATYLGFAITGLALIVKGLLPAEVLGAPVTFMTYTATIMNIGILGLDQALLRFYHEPPAGAEPRQLFAACTRISAAFMMLLGVAGSVFLAQPLAAAQTRRRGIYTQTQSPQHQNLESPQPPEQRRWM